jgi:hypothetical protein
MIYFQRLGMKIDLNHNMLMSHSLSGTTCRGPFVIEKFQFLMLSMGSAGTCVIQQNRNQNISHYLLAVFPAIDIHPAPMICISIPFFLDL